MTISATTMHSKSKVYFTSMRIDHTDSAPAKLKRLVNAAGFDTIDFADQYVALKSHFGEIDNVSYLRPSYARTIAALLKERNAKPFMVDCSTLYPGMRSNAIDALACAEMNGYNAQSCGCPMIIGDGLRGIDDVEVPINGGEELEFAYIGRVIMDADYLITITHAKGCAGTGFGGCLKNVAMGCASRGGKMVMHYKCKPVIIEELCIGCKQCFAACAQDGISFENKKAFINGQCLGCGHCISYCPKNAIQPDRVKDGDAIQLRIAEYAGAVLQNKPAFHISLAIDVTPLCDCFAGNDSPIVGNVGMFASFDPVALDRACVDAINKQAPLQNTRLSESLTTSEPHDYFTSIFPDSNWELCNSHAEKLGLGTKEYELIEVA